MHSETSALEICEWRVSLSLTASLTPKQRPFAFSSQDSEAAIETVSVHLTLNQWFPSGLNTDPKIIHGSILVNTEWSKSRLMKFFFLLVGNGMLRFKPTSQFVEKYPSVVNCAMTWKISFRKIFLNSGRNK